MNTKQLYFNKTIKNWDEAIPLGNGDLAVLYGINPISFALVLTRPEYGIALIRRKSA